MRGWLAVAVMVVGGLGVGPAQAAADPPATGDFSLQTVDGHWQGQVGLPDSGDHGNQGLVLALDPSSASFVTAASVDGVAGLPTSALSSLGAAIEDHPSSIQPCWKVTFIDPSGMTEVVRLPASTDDARMADLGTGPSGGHWTGWTWTPSLPDGTVSSLELEVHLLAAPPSDTAVAFDNLSVNDQTFTSAADGSV
jgi:hypothetical protein